MAEQSLPKSNSIINRGGRKPTHGKSCTRAYNIWHVMRSRCLRPNDIGFSLYGGRGITVCEEWRTDFLQFLADMGEPPTPKHSIDRIDSNGNYEPSNCRWATPKQQARNRSNNTHIEINGVSKTLAEWGDSSPVRHNTILQRLATKRLCNWCAVFLPKQKRGGRLSCPHLHVAEGE